MLLLLKLKGSKWLEHCCKRGGMRVELAELFYCNYFHCRCKWSGCSPRCPRQSNCCALPDLPRGANRIPAPHDAPRYCPLWTLFCGRKPPHPSIATSCQYSVRTLSDISHPPSSTAWHYYAAPSFSPSPDNPFVRVNCTGSSRWPQLLQIELRSFHF